MRYTLMLLLILLTGYIPLPAMQDDLQVADQILDSGGGVREIGQLTLSAGIGQPVTGSSDIGPFKLEAGLLTGSSSQVTQQLAGTYSIGAGGDFTTFSDAATALNTDGISGPVVFEVLSGTYNEQCVINNIAGSSPANTITIRSQANDPDSVTITYRTTALQQDEDYVLKLAGTDYITIEGLTIQPTGTVYGRGLEIADTALNVTITGNIFIGSPADGYQTPASLYGISCIAHNLVVSHNTFRDGGHLAMIIASNSNGGIGGVVIHNNTLTNTLMGMRLDNCYAVVVRNNIISPRPHYSQSGIALNSCNGPIQVLANRITMYGGVGIGIAHCVGISGGQGLVANNFICQRPGQGGFYGLDYFECRLQQILHNTVIERGSTNAFKGVLKITYGDWLDVRNNLFASLTYSPAYGVGSDNTYPDFNNLYTAGIQIANWRNWPALNLDSLNYVVGVDLHSLDVYPQFPDWLQPYHATPWLDGQATPVAEVTVDIDGNPRDPSHPDIGCTEYTADPSTTTPLAGSFTAGDGGDYTKIQDAIDDLVCKGISAPVTINILPGQYYEQLRLHIIPGSSWSDRVTFRSSTGSADDVTLRYITTGVDTNYVFHFNGADHIVIENLTIENDPGYTGGYGKIIYFSGEADDLIFRKNIMRSYHTGFYGYGAYSSHLTIEQNQFEFESYGRPIWLRGGNPTPQGFKFVDNTVRTSTNPGVQIEGQLGAIIDGNCIETRSGIGVQLSNCTGKTRVTNNKIFSGSYSVSRGLEISNCSAYPDSVGIIANNFIQVRASYDGILLNNCKYFDIVHNAVNVTKAVSVLRQYSGGAQVRLYNNIFAGTGGGYAYQFDQPSVITAMDNNDVYTTRVDSLALLGAFLCTDLDSLRVVSSMESNSVSAEPCFYSLTDLHARADALDGAGMPYLAMDIDIDAQTRDAVFPDIGAAEFTYQPNSAPTATEDTASTVRDSAIYINVLANDYDTDGDTLTIIGLIAPSNGTVELGIDDSLIEYTPDTDFVGFDTLDYIVTDGMGCYDDTGQVVIHVGTPSAADDAHASLPYGYSLAQNYPNPFNPTTAITFSLASRSYVRLEIFNLLGQNIRLLTDGIKPAGEHRLVWDGLDTAGNNVATGVYFYRLITDNYTATRKMVLLK